MPKEVHEAKVKAFLDKINSAYKSEIVHRGETFKALNIRRFSSGVASVDLALGGGWPFGRLGIIAGNESTGKTLLALKAAKEIKGYCRNCRLAQDLCKCSDFTPCVCLFVDVEGAFDLAWAKIQGFDSTYHVVARPDYAEQAIDVIDSAIRDNAFDMIVIDSIAALTPMKEVEESAEDWQVGLAARLVNKAMRRWTSSLNTLSRGSGLGGPFILCLNQLRENIGVMYGDPRTMPGGKGQKFASSVTAWTKAAKIQDDPESKESAYVELSGVFKKNKTAVPNLEYSFRMALKDTEMDKAGEVDNADQLVRLGKRYGLVTKSSGTVGFDITRCKTEAAFKSHVKHKPEIAKALWRALIKEVCGV